MSNSAIPWAHLAIAAGIFLLSVLLLALALRIRRSLGLPTGQVVYADSARWGKPEKPLYDPECGLAGKPDYLLQRRGEVIPVEVKSGWAPPVPFDSHAMQLAAYCLLVERGMGVRPPYGLLRYHNRTFRLPYTDEMRERVLGLIVEVRRAKSQEEVGRSHEHKARCARCGYRSICDQRL